MVHILFSFPRSGNQISVSLSSQKAIGTWETECLTIRFPLGTLLYAPNIEKLYYVETPIYFRFKNIQKLVLVKTKWVKRHFKILYKSILKQWLAQQRKWTYRKLIPTPGHFSVRILFNFTSTLQPSCNNFLKSCISIQTMFYWSTMDV